VIREPKGLVELLSGLNHLILHFLGQLEVTLADHELFDFFELVHAEDTPGVLAVLTGLFPKARRDTGVSVGNFA
jgi:hypothetical protein